MRSRSRARRRFSPLLKPALANEVCLEVEDDSVARRSAVDFFGLARADQHTVAKAARLAEQFVVQNRALLGAIDVRIDREYDGSDVGLRIQAGSAVGAIPLISPTSAQHDYGLVVQPRF